MSSLLRKRQKFPKGQLIQKPDHEPLHAVMPATDPHFADWATAGEVERESALVTAEQELFSNQASGFIHERMLKGAGIGVERGRLDA